MFTKKPNVKERVKIKISILEDIYLLDFPADSDRKTLVNDIYNFASNKQEILEIDKNLILKSISEQLDKFKKKEYVLIKAIQTDTIEKTLHKLPAPVIGKQKTHFPLLTIISPIIMGVCMFLIFRTTFMLLMSIMSPVFAISRFIETVFINRKNKVKQDYNKLLRKEIESILSKQQKEKDVLEKMFLPLDVCINSIEQKSHFLWSFDDLFISFGFGRLKSNIQVEYDKTLVDPRLMSVVEELKWVYPVSIGESLNNISGFAIRSKDSFDIANALIIELAHNLPPSKLSIFYVGEKFNYIKWLPHYIKSIDAKRETIVFVDASQISIEQTTQLASLCENGLIKIVWVNQKDNKPPKYCDFLLSDNFISYIKGGKEIELEKINKLEYDKAKSFAKKLSNLNEMTISNALPDLVTFGSVFDDFVTILDGYKNYTFNNLTQKENKTGDKTEIKCILGVATTGFFEIDIKNSGPHMIVAGTTGSGKSELLKSLILCLAVKYPPSYVNFLLIDYKGGAAFDKCSKLPHCTGLITDLSDNLAQRAIVSLKAEIKRREEILNENGAKDIDELQNSKKFPSLFIIIDEFATLVKQKANFLEGVLDIAQRGRSIGIYLVLGTQHPAGVISENILANINIIMCLRVKEEAISKSLIKTSDAAKIVNKGRCFASIAGKMPMEFQCLYAGGEIGNNMIIEKL